MTASEIIDALTPYTRQFPHAAMEAANAQREEVAPLLVHHLEELAEASEKIATVDSMLPLFAAFLLAQFRDQRAFRPLARILGRPEETVESLFGDMITGELPRILASLYDGNPEPIKRLIEGEDVYEFVRGSAVEALVALVHTDQIGRETVVDYFGELFRTKLRREPNQVWNELSCAVATLRVPELIEEVRLAYQDELADPFYADLEGLERDAQLPFALEGPSLQERYTSLITNASEEMEWWACFHPEDEPEDSLDAFVDLPDEPGWAEPTNQANVWGGPDYVPHAGIRRETPKIGRNDLCPCGSGKKYKKCCLGK